MARSLPILVVGAHPAAICDQSGGTMAHMLHGLGSECHYYLPVTDDALKLARMSEHRRTTRQSYRSKVE